jgi:hypothetical protein
MSVLINEAYANGTIPLWAKPSDALYTAGQGITIASNVITANSEAFGTYQSSVLSPNTNGLATAFTKTLVTMTIPAAYVGKLCVATITGAFNPPTMASGTTFGGSLNMVYTNASGRAYTSGQMLAMNPATISPNYYFNVSLPFVPTSAGTIALIFTNLSGVTITTQTVTVGSASLVMTENTTASASLIA